MNVSPASFRKRIRQSHTSSPITRYRS
jgi:hypothetical protein